MLSDRPYMRDDYPREKTSVLTWLMCAMVAGFAVQFVAGSSWISAGRSLESLMALSVPAVAHGRVWTLFTHAFLHSTTFIVHGIFNMFALYFLGRELLPLLGTRRFLGLFAGATVVGGGLWTLVHWRVGGGEMHIGATAAVYALFTVFACFYPNRPLSFLLFFVLPVTLKPKHVAIALTGLALFGFVFSEIPGTPLPLDIMLASSAHLGGIFAGYVYYRFVHHSGWSLRDGRPDMELPRWMKRGRKAATVVEFEPEAPAAEPKPKSDIRAELDRILDKINSQGLPSLTVEEKRMLDAAKDLLSRR